MASVASEICPVRGVRLSCGRHAVQFKMLPQTTRRRQLQARVRQRIPIGAAPKSTTPPGPVLGQRTRREAGWRWGVMVDLGPLGPPWTSSKLMFAQQMPIPQVRPGRAHLGRYPGRRGSTPLPRSAAVRDLAGKTRSRRNGAYSSFRSGFVPRAIRGGAESANQGAQRSRRPPPQGADTGTAPSLIR